MPEDILTCRDLEEHLAPYVDGEATPAGRRMVDVHLAACPPCRAHAGAERTARDLVQGHRDELRASATAALRARCAAQVTASSDQLPASSLQPPVSWMRKWVPLSLAATIVLAVAGVFVFGLNDRVEALAAGLALDHAKCFKVAGASVAGASPEAAAEERGWKQSQGWSIVVPQTAPAEQLKLVDVRRCFSTDGRTAHMMYLWRGEPLSVYVLPRELGHDRMIDRLGHETVIWSANGRTYAVLAEGHPRDFTHIVDYMKAHTR